MTNSFDLRAEADARDDARLLRFLNSLTPLEEPIAWIGTFRDALADLLGDVDRISISMNLQAFDLEHRVAYGHENPASVAPMVVPRSAGDDIAARLINEATLSGFPVDDYHAPAVFCYHAGERTYLAAIILWRSRAMQPIGEASLIMMHTLRPFITYRLSECIDRFMRDDRTARGAGAMACQIGARTGLDPDEREILALTLAGLSIGAIALRTGLTVASVRKHVAAIHRVTGTFDVGEIIRRFVGESDE
jgi:DNA-binding CsgD family transcriptional regulator